MSLLLRFPIRFRDSKRVVNLISNRLYTTQNPNLAPFPDHPTSAYYDEQINAAGRSGGLDTVWSLLNKRIHDGCFNTANTFKFLDDNCSYASLLGDIRSVIRRLDPGLTRSGAWNMLVARLCKLGKLEDALSVAVEDMAGDSLKISTFYPILSSLTRKKKLDQARRVLNIMRSHAIEPDVTAYNYFLTAYCVVGDVGGARKVVKAMEEAGVHPDARTHDALVLCACRSGKLEGAMVVLRRMEDDGVPVAYSTHAHVIGAMVRKSYYAQAVNFVTAYGGKDEKLDTESFGGLASKLITKARRREAMLVLEEMAKRGLKMGTQLTDFYHIHVNNKVCR